ncbi:hypothetical protein T492DRAFT_1006466 [Pavlovales sp. CCMP2436]|nr:hypothetical protein T492DRAFT_1006466 [Pavlovales sp. CCMP2436]
MARSARDEREPGSRQGKLCAGERRARHGQRASHECRHGGRGERLSARLVAAVLILKGARKVRAGGRPVRRAATGVRLVREHAAAADHAHQGAGARRHRAQGDRAVGVAHKRPRAGVRSGQLRHDCRLPAGRCPSAPPQWHGIDAALTRVV